MRAHLIGALLLAACNGSSNREVEVDLTAAWAPRRPIAVDVAPRSLTFSVAAMQAPSATYVAYSRLFQRMGELLGVEIRLVERRTYGELDELVQAGRLDVAFVCTGGYLDLARRAPGAVEVLAVALVDGADTYRALIVVGSGSSVERVEDLMGKRFAFTDELSLTGHTYPLRRLSELGYDPDTFFGSTLFSHGHERSLRAVARGIVDGAAVAEQVYESATIGRSVRVIERSPPFGAPPVVAATRLSAELRRRIQRVLWSLDQDPLAAATLHELHTERFVPPRPGMYESAARLVEGRR